MPTEPLINSKRAREIYALLTDELSDLEDNMNDAIDAHTAGMHQFSPFEQQFYQAIMRAKRNQAQAQRIVTLLSQGRYEDAERELGLAK